MAYPKAQDYADFQRGLQQGFATGEMGFNINSAKILNGPCPRWILGCSLTPGARWLRPTDAAVLGISARYVPNDMAFPLAVCGRV
jgi:hypothetical protein